MTSFKKLALVSVLAASAVATSVASADSFGGHFGVGPAIGVTSFGNAGGVSATYFAPKFLASVTSSYVRVSNIAPSSTDGVDNSKDSQSIFDLSGMVGLRNAIGNNTNFDYGLSAGKVFLSNRADGVKNPHFYGAVVGVDYAITPKLIGNVAVSPYTHYVGATDIKQDAVFAAAGVGVTYLFT